MIALDTNVLVRYLAQDDEEQLQSVLRLLNKKKATFFLLDLVLVECAWVLRSLYDWSAAEVADAYARLTSIHNLIFEDEARLRASLKALRGGADLADEMIDRKCRDVGCQRLATFDAGLVKRHGPFAVKPV